MVEPRTGYRIGDDEGPDVYELTRPVRTAGEGEVWQAVTVRQDGITDHRWAVKILHARHLVSSGDETPNSALRYWLARYRASVHETEQLREHIPGVVGAMLTFPGDEPHPPGEHGQDRCLYVVSRWIEGDDLGVWRTRHDRSFDDVCDVLTNLAAIVDGMAGLEKPVVHRDISPDNVMVRPDGQVRLIDFTFVRPPNTAAGTVMVFKRGYSAPETRTGQAGLSADRYSFGAVAYYLLARAEPAIEDVPADSRAVLIRTGFSSEVADHVAALLAPDPAARPTNLVEWTTQLRKLGHRESAPTRYRMVTLTVDGTATPVTTAGGTDGVASVRLGVGMTWRLQADVTSPPAVTALAAVTDGSGTQASFAIDEGGTVLVGRSGQWQDQGRVVAGSGLAATRDAQGRAVAYVVDPNAHDLTTITVGLDGTTRRFATGRPVRRVLAATPDRDGSTALFVLAPDGSLACISAEGASRIGEDSALDAAGCLDHWGELRCYRVTAGQPTLSCFDRSTGEWALTETAEAPITPTAVACAGHRNGVTIALAGPDGLYLASHSDDGVGPWRKLTDRPGSVVTLATGAAWRLWLAALVDGRVVLAREDFTGEWSMGLTAL